MEDKQDHAVTIEQPRARGKKRLTPLQKQVFGDPDNPEATRRQLLREYQLWLRESRQVEHTWLRVING